MRCSITKPSKLRKIERAIGEPIEYAVTRGGTNHRIDAYTLRGVRVSIWPDGSKNEGSELGSPSVRETWDEELYRKTGVRHLKGVVTR